MRVPVVVLIVLTILVGAGAYFAADYWAGDNHPHPATMHDTSIHERLDLTPDQQRRIEQVHAKFRSKRIELRERHRDRRSELLELLQQQPPDRERISEKIEQISTIQKKMQQEAIEHILKVASELDASQRGRLFELLDEAMCPGAMMGPGANCEQDAAD